MKVHFSQHEVEKTVLPFGKELHYRTFSDPYILAESAKKTPFYYRHGDILPTDTIIEVGAQIGVTTLWAREAAAQVVAYEAEPENFRFLELNCDYEGIYKFNLFVCGNSRKEQELPLYLANKDLSSHSAYVQRGRSSVVVRTIPVRQVLETYRPQVFKMDAEGSEYEIILDGLLENWELLPEVISFEAHFGKKKWHEDYARCISELTRLGYAVEAPASSNGWPVFVHASKRLFYDQSH